MRHVFGSSDRPLADQRSVIVAEMGLSPQDDGKPALLQPVNIVGAISLVGGTILYPRPNVNSGVPLELFGSEYAAARSSTALRFLPLPLALPQTA
jgi:hypothetical protein